MNLEKYRERIHKAIDSYYIEGDVIDTLFISHLHTDHILGVTYLAKKCDIKRIILPQLTEAEKLAMFLEDLCDLDYDDSIDEMAKSWQTIFSEKHDRIEVLRDKVNVNDANYGVDLENLQDDIKSGQTILFRDKWQYIPYNSPVKNVKVKDLLDVAKEQCKEIFNVDKISFDKLRNYLKSVVNRDKLKSAYNDVFNKEKLNETSMTLYSGMCGCNQKCERHCGKAIHDANRYCTLNCLYLGDFEAKKQDYFNGLMEVYGPYFNYIGIIQVPHHGSNNNYNAYLYSSSSPDKSSSLHKICIFSADSNDKYEHPDEDVLDGIRKEGGIPVLVTECKKTKQVFILGSLI